MCLFSGFLVSLAIHDALRDNVGVFILLVGGWNRVERAAGRLVLLIRSGRRRPAQANMKLVTEHIHPRASRLAQTNLPLGCYPTEIDFGELKKGSATSSTGSKSPVLQTHYRADDENVVSFDGSLALPMTLGHDCPSVLLSEGFRRSFPHGTTEKACTTLIVAAP